jgi:hypothetical protein
MDDPGTPLWTLWREGRDVTCVVRLVPHGVEVDITSEGSPIVTGAFATGDDALAWAEKTRQHRLERGWS